MTRGDLLKQLETYTSQYDEELACVERFNALLQYDNCYERSLEFGHITASAWILDAARENALLLHHKKLNRWLQPGGHADGDENLVQVARKEVEEETGLKDLPLMRQGIFDLDIHMIPARKEVPAHEHYDVRFVFEASDTMAIAKNHESNDLEWVPLSEIEKYVDHEQSIMRMREKTASL